jgi:hypothetical protein
MGAPFLQESVDHKNVVTPFVLDKLIWQKTQPRTLAPRASAVFPGFSPIFKTNPCEFV